MVHEYQMHKLTDGACMCTLTYNDENIPTDKLTGVQTLRREHFTNFMKRLRYALDKPIKYYGCGEYGSKTGRPHYHFCLFGENFRKERTIIPCNYNLDAQKFMKKGSDRLLYYSETLQRAWSIKGVPIGNVSLTEFSAATAHYCAKYMVKSYEDYFKDAELRALREAPFSSISNGIGKEYFEKYYVQWFQQDLCKIGTMKLKPDRYYEKMLEKKDPGLLENVKRKRREYLNKQDKEKLYNYEDNNTHARYYATKVNQKGRMQ